MTLQISQSVIICLWNTDLIIYLTLINGFQYDRLLQLQWKQNMKEATAIINKAIELDPKCEYAYEVLGTLEVQK